MDQKEAGARLADLQLLRSRRQWVLVRSQAAKAWSANLVVVPKAMGQGGKKQKTDRRDSAQLVDDLDRYMRGNEKALSVVGVPSEEQEEKRALIRYQLQIMGDRKRCEARGKGL